MTTQGPHKAIKCYTTKNPSVLIYLCLTLFLGLPWSYERNKGIFDTCIHCWGNENCFSLCKYVTPGQDELISSDFVTWGLLYYRISLWNINWKLFVYSIYLSCQILLNSFSQTMAVTLSCSVPNVLMIWKLRDNNCDSSLGYVTYNFPRWHHDVEIFSALLALCESIGHQWIPLLQDQ